MWVSSTSCCIRVSVRLAVPGYPHCGQAVCSASHFKNLVCDCSDTALQSQRAEHLGQRTARHVMKKAPRSKPIPTHDILNPKKRSRLFTPYTKAANPSIMKAKPALSFQA